MTDLRIRELHAKFCPPFTLGEFYLLSIAVCGSGLIGLLLGGGS
jgi:hypothetical protein